MFLFGQVVVLLGPVDPGNQVGEVGRYGDIVHPGLQKYNDIYTTKGGQ